LAQTDFEKMPMEIRKTIHDFWFCKKDFTMDIADYEVADFVESGSSGSVNKAVHKPTGRMVAIKSIAMNSSKITRFSNIVREVALHRLVGEHPNIVELYAAFQDDVKVYLVMELMETELLSHLDQHGGSLDETEIRRIFTQVCKGINHCHKVGVLHADIKPDNIVMNNSTGEVKVCDFGLSELLASKGHAKVANLRGSFAYLSLDCLQQRRLILSPCTDVWAMGVSLFACKTGFMPFVVEHESIEAYIGVITEHMWLAMSKCSDELQETLDDMLNHDADARHETDSLIHQLSHGPDSQVNKKQAKVMPAPKAAEQGTIPWGAMAEAEMAEAPAPTPLGKTKRPMSQILKLKMDKLRRRRFSGRIEFDEQAGDGMGSPASSEENIANRKNFINRIFRKLAGKHTPPASPRNSMLNLNRD